MRGGNSGIERGAIFAPARAEAVAKDKAGTYRCRR
jgi:hypothetical protein